MAAVGVAICSSSGRIKAENSVVAWGAGKIVAHPADLYNYGQSIVPSGLTNAMMLAGGWRHSLALINDGTIIGWGDNQLGQTTNLMMIASNEWMIACGGLHSLALNTNSRVRAAGDNGHQQISVPLNLTNVVSLAGGFYHSLALRADGTVVAWGMGTNDIGTDPNYGQCRVPGAATNVVAIGAGGWHSVALRGDGSVLAWGRNDSRQVDIPEGLSNVVAIAAGGVHTMALRQDGTVMVWGDNNYGQTNVPSGLSNVVAIAAGGWHCLALKSDGRVVAWGAGTTAVNTNLVYGQSTVPAGLTNVIQVAAGWAHSLALVGMASPVLRAQAVGATNGQGFSVFIPTQNGRVYRLEYKENLNASGWETLPLQAGTGKPLELRDTNTPPGARFYRVERW